MSNIYHERNADGDFILVSEVPGPDDITIDITTGPEGEAAGTVNIDRETWEKMRDAIDKAFKRANIQSTTEYEATFKKPGAGKIQVLRAYAGSWREAKAKLELHAAKQFPGYLLYGGPFEIKP